MYFGFIKMREQVTVSHFLVDALTNIEIASSISVGGATLDGLSQEEFLQVKSEFFPEER